MDPPTGVILLGFALSLAVGFAVGRFLTPSQLLDSDAIWYEHVFRANSYEEIQRRMQEEREHIMEQAIEGTVANKQITREFRTFPSIGEAREHIRSHTSKRTPLMAVRVGDDQWFIGGWA